MRAIFSNKFKKDLTLPSELYLAGWEEKYEDIPLATLSELAVTGERVRLENLKHPSLRTQWDNVNKDLELWVEGIDVEFPEDGTHDDLVDLNYVESIFFYYGFEDEVDLAFILVPEDNKEISLTGNNIINLQLLDTTKAEFVNFKKNIENDFDFLEGTVSEAKTRAKNILVLDSKDEVLVTKDSYYRLLRTKAAEEGCKEGRCIDETGKYQNSYYTYRTYKEGTLKPILFDTTGSTLMTKYNLSLDGGYVQVRGVVDYEEWKVGKNGLVEKVGEGTTGISGIDGVTVILESKSPYFNCTIDEAWNRVVYEKLLEENEASWGIFRLELSYLGANKEPVTISSKPFKLVQGSFDSYIDITNPSTSFTELGSYLFMFEADGNTTHNFTLVVSTSEVIKLENIEVSAPSGSDLEYMQSKFKVEYDNLQQLDNGTVTIDFKLSTTGKNESRSLPLPAKNDKFELIPLIIKLKDTDTVFQGVNFYLVQKPVTVDLVAFENENGYNINKVVLDYTQTTCDIILGLSEDIDGDYWKLTGPTNRSVRVSPEVGLINGVYSTVRGYSGFQLDNQDEANKITLTVEDIPATTRDKSYGTISFTRYLTNPTGKDLSGWRMNLSVATVTIEVIKKGAPPTLIIPEEYRSMLIKRIEAKRFTIKANTDIYCKFVPVIYKEEENPELTGSNSIVGFLKKNPEYAATLYVAGQSEEVTHIGNNLYKVSSNRGVVQGTIKDFDLALEVKFFSIEMVVNSQIIGDSKFGHLDFYYDEACTNFADSIDFSWVLDSSISYKVGVKGIEYDGAYTEDISKFVWKNKYFFIPPDKPVTVYYDCPYTLWFNDFDAKAADGHNYGGSQVTIKPVGNNGSDTFTTTNTGLSLASYKSPYYKENGGIGIGKLTLPVYENSILKGFAFECSANGLRSATTSPMLPRILFFNNNGTSEVGKLEDLSYYGDAGGSPSESFVYDNPEQNKRLMCFYFFRVPEPIHPVNLYYSNYRNNRTVSGSITEVDFAGLEGKSLSMYKLNPVEGYSRFTHYSPTNTYNAIIPYSSSTKEEGYGDSWFSKVAVDFEYSSTLQPQFIEVLGDTKEILDLDISQGVGGKCIQISGDLRPRDITWVDTNVKVHTVSIAASWERSAVHGMDPEGKKVAYMNIISCLSFNSDADPNVTSLGKVKLYFRPNVVEDTKPVSSNLQDFNEKDWVKKDYIHSSYDSESHDVNLVRELPDVIGDRLDKTIDGKNLFNYWRDNIICPWLDDNIAAVDFYKSRFYQAAGTISILTRNQEIEKGFIYFIRNLLTSYITLELKYLKDTIYTTGIDDGIAFNGGFCNPVLNYSSPMVKSTLDSEGLTVGCVSRITDETEKWSSSLAHVPSSYFATELSNVIDISCQDRSTIINNYSENIERVKGVVADSEWSANFSIMTAPSTLNSSQIKESDLLKKTFTISGIQKGHNSGILISNSTLYVGSVSGNASKLTDDVSSGETSYTLSCKAVSISPTGVLTGIDGIEVESNYDFDIRTDSIVFHFPKNTSTESKEYVYVITYKNEDGVVDLFELTIIQSGLVSVLEWDGEDLPGNQTGDGRYLLHFLSDGTCTVNQNETSTISFISNIKTLYVIEYPKLTEDGSNYLDESYTGVLYGESYENGDDKYLITVPIQVPPNNTDSTREGTLVISTTPPGNNSGIVRTFRCVQGYYTLKVKSGKNGVIYSADEAIQVSSNPANPVNLYLETEKMEYVYNSGVWDLTLFSTQLPANFNTFTTNPRFYTKEGNLPMENLRVVRLNSATDKPTLSMEWDSVDESIREFNFYTDGFKVTLEGDSFYKEGCNYKFYGDSIEFSLDYLYYHYYTE